ncbi:hypothetical protein E2493_17610 [Sphingomonas parva]|uniref:Uncharacterized protein n=1 Tax=Sphingomonas parva TaxID=2555898 RepID=A0A4Y8ZNU0_9SPHN|nr:DUF6519 domain-containing protein [Sphingomonas parva]TFI56942.1 hypothetical protein E2493_17610 [Sphingomonas parva]
MKGDFSRVSFNAEHGFTRVNAQQGRMQLDADANEQQAINLQLVRTLAADLIGPHGGLPGSFQIEADAGLYRGFRIRPGRYYVDGWPAWNRAVVGYSGGKDLRAQPWYPAPPEIEEGQAYLVYLEVWERHVSAAEFDRARDPHASDAMREVALDGPDTASRAQLVWQVKARSLDTFEPSPDGADDPWATALEQIAPGMRGTLKAKAAEPPAAGGPPCEVSPRARFRGDSDQLYRVEIRRGGPASAKEGGATFVWSRDNGAVTFPVDKIAGPKVQLAAGWRDARFAIAPGDIVEVAGPAEALQETSARLLRVMDYDPDSATVTLEATPEVDTDDPRRPVLLRRWDHGALRGPTQDRPKLADDNALQLVEGRWLTLEEGIQVMFGDGGLQDGDNLPPRAEMEMVRKDAIEETGDRLPTKAREELGRADRLEKGDRLGRGRQIYRQGDYWQIPSRIALSDVLGPRDAAGAPLPRPPDGVERHYAPLALIRVAGDGSVTVERDLRREFRPLTETAR